MCCSDKYKSCLRNVVLPDAFIIVVLTTGLCAGLNWPDKYGIKVIGTVPAGVPAFQAIDFSWVTQQWGSMIFHTVLISPIVAVISLSIVIKFSTQFKYEHEVDPNQEMIALGASSLFGSIFQTNVSCGSLSRSAVLADAGSLFFSRFSNPIDRVMQVSDCDDKKRAMVLQTVSSSCICSHPLVPCSRLINRIPASKRSTNKLPHSGAKTNAASLFQVLVVVICLTWFSTFSLFESLHLVMHWSDSSDKTRIIVLQTVLVMTMVSSLVPRTRIRTYSCLNHLGRKEPPTGSPRC